MEFYKDRNRLRFQVGIFSVLALIILLAAYSWLTDLFQSRNYSQIKVRFEDIGNIQKSSPVNILGVNSGKVESIELAENSVILTILVNLEFPLRKGTIFRIRDTDIMGGVEVLIIPGRENEILDLNVIQNGESGSGINNLVMKLTGIITTLEKSLLSESGRNFLEEFSRLIENSQELIDDLDNLIMGNSADFKLLLQRSNSTMQELEEIISTNKAGIGVMVTEANRNLDKFEESLKQMKTILSNFSEISVQMANEDSSFRRLITEKKLYENILKSTISLDSLLIDLKQNPQRYFKMKLF